MRKTITIYFNPEYNHAHVLHCEVNEESGEYIVNRSVIETCIINFSQFVDHFRALVGESNIRVYTCAEWRDPVSLLSKERSNPSLM